MNSDCEILLLSSGAFRNLGAEWEKVKTKLENWGATKETQEDKGFQAERQYLVELINSVVGVQTVKRGR